MDKETQERFHSNELAQQKINTRLDGIDLVLKQQADAFTDFKKTINKWAARFAYIIIGSVLLSVQGDQGSFLLALLGKVLGI